MNLSTDVQGTHQVCNKLEVFNVGTIYHMANIKVEFKFCHFVQGACHHGLNSSPVSVLIIEVSVAEEGCE
jgi:hypothetical protein